jgi:hypothetical protein
MEREGLSQHRQQQSYRIFITVATHTPARAASSPIASEIRYDMTHLFDG